MLHIFVPNNPLVQKKMNLNAAFPRHIQIINDQLMNDAIFYCCENVITKGIETQN